MYIYRKDVKGKREREDRQRKALNSIVDGGANRRKIDR